MKPGSMQFLMRWMLITALALPALLSAQTLQFDPSKILTQPATQNAAPELPAEVISQGYLYLEPNQMRFEVLFDATTVLAWAKMPAAISLNADEQKALADALEAKAADWCRAGVGKPAEGNFLGASIIKGKPGATLPLEEGDSLPTREAMVGLMWEFPLPPLPDEITLQWTGYIQGQKRLPIRVFFGVKSDVIEADAASKQVRWRVKGRLPMPAPLAAVPKIETLPPWRVPMASVIWFCGGLVIFLLVRRKSHRLPGGAVSFLGAWFIGALLTWPLFVVTVPRGSSVPEVSDNTQAEAILAPLLRNVYRAFDYRTESDIYDTLARSVDGELLRKLYLETLQALTLEGREGTRVTISEFSVEIMAVKPASTGQGFITDCQWTALGTVGHWGHAHTRVNRYTATVTVAPVESEWKVVALEVQEARRI
ncbi:hypothetical protein WJU23_16650 [Prosthecobacter sp. SYSU 5D2]|uniref:hypothetical protein n=1 Tax=Prosthecobacter sp. SYSU 5D2 TaxID=3134134 RepID=UPI0031FF35CB